MSKLKIGKVRITITLDMDLNAWLDDLVSDFRLNKSLLLNLIVAKAKKGNLIETLQDMPEKMKSVVEDD